MDCYRLVCIPGLSYSFITSSITRHHHLCGEDVNPIPNRKPILDAFALTLLTGCHFKIEKAKIHLSRDHLLNSRQWNVTKVALDEYSPRDNILILMSSSLDFLARNLDILTSSQKVWPSCLELTGKTRDTSTFKHTLILACLGIFEVPRMQRLQKAGIAVLCYFLEGLGGEISTTINIRVRSKYSPAIDNVRLSISFRANTLNFLNPH